MKIHKTVNPVAYENTYYIEGDQRDYLQVYKAKMLHSLLHKLEDFQKSHAPSRDS